LTWTSPSQAQSYDHGLDDLGDPIVRVFKDESNPAHSEMTNYANWFAYYRTRLQAVKTVTSITFNELDSKYRVGFHTLFHTDTILPTFLDIADFDPAVQKPAWFSKLFGVSISLGQETPTLDAMVRVGEYFKHGSHPQLTGSSDPIVLSCQKNYHLLFTDGYTNQSGLPSDFIAGDQDLTIPNYPEWDTKPILGLVPGSDWPGPFQEDTDIATGRASNSLSDYAMYYWVTDLRGSTGTTVLPNDVPASDKDPATWQHQNFAAVSLGTSGKLPATNQSVTEDALTTGGMKWPKPYPNVFKPDNSGVDDLWHAALNGRGRFVNAQSIDEVKLGIGKVLADTANVSGTRTAAGFQSINVTGSNNFIYRVRFEPDWAGSLTKVQINSSTGAEVAEMWKAATQLTAQLAITAGKPTPWFTERKIVTVNESGTAVPFLWGNLGGKQQDSLFPGKPARGSLVLEFLRGNRLNEGVRVHQFRVRGNVLGDIVDSSPVYVGKPSLPYRDSDDPGYSGFKSALAGRAARVYVGANEGMFHAFDDATGNETWAYIPSVLYRGGTAGGDPKTGLGALAYQDGALPPFKHHFFVDSTPRITDVDFGSEDWHTIACRRARQGRQDVLRARCHAAGGHHHRNRGGGQGPVGVHRPRHGLQLRQADDRQDACFRWCLAGGSWPPVTTTPAARATCTSSAPVTDTCSRK
jgi:type IV pilus assembly protein PilY1